MELKFRQVWRLNIEREADSYGEIGLFCKIRMKGDAEYDWFSKLSN